MAVTDSALARLKASIQNRRRLLIERAFEPKIKREIERMASQAAEDFAAGGNCYFDGIWKWDTANENALSLDVYEEGVFSVMSIVKATGGNRVPILEVEGTDYFVHYEAGNDFLVSTTDLSNDGLWGLAALEP